MALSLDFRGSVSFPPGYPSYRTLTFVLVGLTPTEYTSLRWTYVGNSSCLYSWGYTLSGRLLDDGVGHRSSSWVALIDVPHVSAEVVLNLPALLFRAAAGIDLIGIQIDRVRVRND